MKTFTRTGLMALALVAMTSAAFAQQHVRVLPLNHNHQYHLPQVGFYSEFVGYGEEITQVLRRSIASRMGLESGDVILAVNGQRLNYEGAWFNAFRRAAASGYVQLKIRDVNTGRIVSRGFYTNEHVINSNTLKHVKSND